MKWVHTMRELLFGPVPAPAPMPSVTDRQQAVKELEDRAHAVSRRVHVLEWQIVSPFGALAKVQRERRQHD